MASLYLLIPIAIVFVCIAVGIFLWAVRTEQFEDLERQAMTSCLTKMSQSRLKTRMNALLMR